jgi:hypothetical protein
MIVKKQEKERKKQTEKAYGRKKNWVKDKADTP